MGKIGYLKDKETGENRPVNLSQVIVVKPPVRQSHGIETYVNAFRAADRGNMQRLYDLFQDLIDRDPIVAEAIAKRQRGVTNARIMFQDAKKKITRFTMP